MNKFRFEQGIRIYGQEGTKKTLRIFMDHPFTYPIRDLPIDVKVKDLSEGTHRIPFRVTCKPLLHVDRCFGYRIKCDGRIVTYCTDTGICDNSLELARNADVLIHECAEKTGQRTPKWPHTAPFEAAELANKAKVKQLILFHFSAAIYQSADDRKEAERDAKVIFQNTIAAIDGMELTI